MKREIHVATTESQLRACYPVMRELRDHLDEETFLRMVEHQAVTQQYRLAYLALEGVPACVAGYRVADNLSAGRHLYVDDLATASEHRRKGLASAMLAWLEEEAQRLECGSLHLDSGVQRHGAHRLYIGAGMDIVFYHFKKQLAG
ncbi:MAG: hypothetical protein RLZZ303_2365 [Candidatus Hydrogenedentota bacterium]|jgi:GNAT superfamily N-acetyltransferase